MAQTRSQFQVPQFNARNPRSVPAVTPAPENKPEWYDRAANAHGDQAQAMRISTRDVKMNIAILSAWLGNPAHRLTRDERIEMRVRLDAYRTELRRRGDIAKAAHKARSQGRNPRAGDKSTSRQGSLH